MCLLTKYSSSFFVAKQIIAVNASNTKTNNNKKKDL